MRVTTCAPSSPLSLCLATPLSPSPFQSPSPSLFCPRPSCRRIQSSRAKKLEKGKSERRRRTTGCCSTRPPTRLRQTTLSCPSTSESHLLSSPSVSWGTGREGFQGGGRDDQVCSAQESGQPTGVLQRGSFAGS